MCPVDHHLTPIPFPRKCNDTSLQVQGYYRHVTHDDNEFTQHHEMLFMLRVLEMQRFL